MIPRKLASKLISYSGQYPIVTLTGPRQSGKTTLARHLFPSKDYVSLEDLDVRRSVAEDPRGFLADHPDGAIIDEVQNVPELFSYLQTEVDRNDKPGRFILTGSQQFEMLEKISQSLAGRTALAKLLPFEMQEIAGLNQPSTINQAIYTGFYPRIHDKNQNPTEAMSFYASTYLERDVRRLINITDLSRFELFLKLCAGRIGQLLNFNSIGNEVGASHNTIKSWIAVLEASYTIFLLRPWHANLSKRLVKTPKLYFIDTGLACYLNGIFQLEHLATHPLRGNLFENLIIADTLKQRLHAGKPNNLYFYRDSNGYEVDLLLEQGNAIDAIEIKSSQTINPDFAKGLNYLGDQNVKLKSKRVIYGGDQSQTRSGISYIPWSRFRLD